MDGIDPRLREPEQQPTSQPPIYSGTPLAQYPQPPLRLPPPSPQQHHHEEPVLHPLQQAARVQVPPWPQLGGQGYYQQPPHSNIFPQGGGTTAPVSSNEPGAGDSKRPRACEACRGLKVRCEFDGAAKDCKRCIKAGRPCQITQPSRKRQKKTDTKVAELERKLEDLRSELVAKGNLPLATSNGESDRHEQDNTSRTSLGVQDTNASRGNASLLPIEEQGQIHESLGDSWGEPLEQQSSYVSNAALASRKRRLTSFAEEEGSRSGQNHTNSPEYFHKTLPPDQRPKQTTIPTSDISSIHPLLMAQPTYSNAASGIFHDRNGTILYGDIVEKCLPDNQAAFAAFRHYTSNMAPQTPIVVFEPSMDPEYIRRTKPVLFAAIIATSYQGAPKASLISEVNKVLASQIVVERKASVELIQAMQIMSLFDWPATEAVNNICIGMATNMTLNTGLHYGAQDRQISEWAFGNPRLSHSELIDAARANVGCFLVERNAIVGSRSHSLSFAGLNDESKLRVLDHSANLTATDKLLCDWLRIERLASHFHWQAYEGRVLASLPGVEQEMEEIKDHMIANQVPNAMMMIYYAASLFIYEVAASEPATAGRSRYVDARLASIHSVLEYFLKLTATEVFNLPVFQFTRVAYALFANYAMRAEVPNDRLQLSLYIDGVLALLRESTRNGPNKVLRCHLVLIAALHDWIQNESHQVPSNGVTGVANPPAGVVKAYHLALADSVQYKAFENREVFFKVVEETAGRMVI